jgi:hypothetical protein
MDFQKFNYKHQVVLKVRGSNSTGRLFKSLPQTIWPGQQKKENKLLASNLSMHVHTCSRTEKTTEQITNKTYPDHNRCWKSSSLLLLNHSLP